MANELKWKRAKAGETFGGDAVVIRVDSEDTDARLGRFAVYDCMYIRVDELRKLPVENG